MGTSDEPQLSTQDNKCQDNPAELPSVSTYFHCPVSENILTTPTEEIGIS